ncbi:MAG TPA: hypothetical protein VN920_12245, partial [Pyrinomonadaceae bacterium]|nr:hypothetical protein [Pyrinomonadaceae bacterium]
RSSCGSCTSSPPDRHRARIYVLQSVDHVRGSVADQQRVDDHQGHPELGGPKLEITDLEFLDCREL